MVNQKKAELLHLLIDYQNQHGKSQRISAPTKEERRKKFKEIYYYEPEKGCRNGRTT